MRLRINVAAGVTLVLANRVIRDILQNHLTELLALVAMELPTHGEEMSAEAFLHAKNELLRQV